jgi:hypothetical protein
MAKTVLPRKRREYHQNNNNLLFSSNKLLANGKKLRKKELKHNFLKYSRFEPLSKYW